MAHRALHVFGQRKRLTLVASGVVSDHPALALRQHGGAMRVIVSLAYTVRSPQPWFDRARPPLHSSIRDRAARWRAHALEDTHE
jgi:hypothetical protein